jgi:tyrosine-protein phosphatase YwqE
VLTDPAVKSFGTTVKKASKKVVEANFLYFIGSEEGVIEPAVKPFGTNVKKASKKVLESNFLYFVRNAKGC